MPLTQTMFTGMDMDTAYSLRNQKKYFKLRNGTLTIDEEMGTGTISNVNGTVRTVQIPDVVQPASVDSKSIETTYNHWINGACVVDDYIVLFTTEYTNNEAPSDYGNPSSDRESYALGAIWAFKYDDDTLAPDDRGDVVTDGTWNGITYLLDCDVHLKFYDYLGFYLDKPLRTIGNSESDDRKKVYFTDSINNLRTINIMEEGVENEPLDHLELLENVQFYSPTTKVLNGGLFYPGQVQYSFQLFTYGGSETLVAPASELVNITAEDLNLSSSSQFKGTEYIENSQPTSKAIRVTIPKVDDDFEYVKIIRIHYRTEYAMPQIDIVAEFGVSEEEEIVFVDNGDLSLGNISLQQYLSLGGTIFTAEDLAVSNNRLIAANISEEFYNPNYDARVYRFDTVTGKARIDDADGTNYILFADDGTWIEYDGGGVVTGVTGINFDYSVSLPAFDPMIDDQSTYAWKDDGGASYERGGKGPNISYKFDRTEMILEDGRIQSDPQAVWQTHDNCSRTEEYFVREAPNVTGDHINSQDWATGPSEAKLGEGWIDNKDEYTNYASPINSALLTGYQRGEIYRFGIVWFDKRGRSSFVHWIGDIKFPEIWEYAEPSETTSFALTYVGIDSPYAVRSVMYPLGIQFTVDNPPQDATSFQIVRTIRDEPDRTVVASGYITPVLKGGWDDHADAGDAKNSVYKPPSSMLRDWITKLKKNDNNWYVHRSGGPSWASCFGTTRTGVGTLNGVTQPDEGNFTMVYEDKMFNFFSPEISFIKNIESAGTTMKIVGSYDPESSSEYCLETNGHALNPYVLFYKSLHVNQVAETNVTDFDIEDMTIVTTETGDKRINVGSAPEYVHRYFGLYAETESGYKGDRYWGGQGGTGGVGYASTSISTALTSAGIYSDYVIPYVQMRRDVIPYNGHGEANRRTLKYRPCSALNAIDTDPVTVDVYQGDTYITMFEHMRLYLTRINAGTGLAFAKNTQNEEDLYESETYMDRDFVNPICIPVETTINCDWRTDDSFAHAPLNSSMCMKEVKGSHDDVEGNIYNQEADSYSMNWTYLRSSGSKLYQEEPLFFDELTTHLSHRLISSDAKYDGELADSWLKFKPNNFTDANGENGPVVAIESIGENLYFFQRKGIGLTRIDERALVNDSEGVSLVLGTGDIFGKQQYVAKDVSLIAPESVVKGKKGIYFYDSMNKTISVIGREGAQDLARLTGVRSYIKNNLDKDLSNPDCNVIAGFDPTIDMVYFTFLNEWEPRVNDDFTIGYSEVIQDFVSLYDFSAGGFISDRTRFLSWARSSPGVLQMHNVGVKGDFYGTQFDTTLTLLISDQPAITKVFDGIEYTHDADESLGGPPATSQTFSRIRAYNNFLDTGLVSANPKFRFRTWRAKLPRFTEGSKENRILGKYLKIDLEFDNSVDNELYLQPTITTWRPVAFIQP